MKVQWHVIYRTNSFCFVFIWFGESNVEQISKIRCRHGAHNANAELVNRSSLDTQTI